MENAKLIGEVFSDYKTDSNIKDAIINSINLIKKANVLELNISSNEYIEIKELWYLEKFLKERFQFSNVDMKISYFENVTIKPKEVMHNGILRNSRSNMLRTNNIKEDV